MPVDPGNASTAVASVFVVHGQNGAGRLVKASDAAGPSVVVFFSRDIQARGHDVDHMPDLTRELSGVTNHRGPADDQRWSNGIQRLAVRRSQRRQRSLVGPKGEMCRLRTH